MLASRRPTTALLAVLAAGAVLASGEARAQTAAPGSAAAAQALFDQASAEMDEKQYAAACPRLEEVTRLVPEGIGARLALAECYEATGRLASAWSQLAAVAALAEKAGQAQRSKEAGARAAALRPKLATLTIEVPAAVRSLSGVVVKRDNAEVGEAQWGAALPVDAGRHEVTVTAPDHGQWTKHVEVDADGVKVSIEAQAPPALAPERPPPARAWQRPIGIGGVAVGGAGVVIGGVLAGLAKARYDEAVGRCTLGPAGMGCGQSSVDLASGAVGLGDGATVAMVAGGVVLAGGLALWLTAPPSPSPSPAGAKGGVAAIGVDIGPGRGGLVLRGAW
jgi:tetratricopeptide (TPR) repeat protein